MSKYKVVIEREVISLNLYLKWHWAKRRNYNTLCDLELLRFKSEIPKAEGKRKIKFTCYRKRLLDFDNQTLKPWVDSIVDAGLLLDDSMKWVEHDKHEQKIDKENPRIEIELEDIIPGKKGENGNK